MPAAASRDEHRIAVAEESVARRDGLEVGAEDVLLPRECRDEHEERRAGEVEVRQERVDDVKCRAGYEEEIRLERPGGDSLAVCAGRGLERAYGRRADRHDAPPLSFRAIHALGGVRGNLRPLEVHPVLLDAVHLHGLERAEAHVQRHARDLDTFRGDGGEQLFREVQARGGRRDRAGAIREDGLVVDRVLRVRDAKRTVDVGGKRSGTERRQVVEERRRCAPVLFQVENVKAAFGASRERLGLPTPFEEKLPPGLHPPSRSCEAAPELLSPFRRKIRNPGNLRNLRNQQEFRSSSLLVRPENPRRDDLRVVQDEDVARAKKAGKIADGAMAEHARRAVQRHEARGAARRGPLGDRFGRQHEVEIRDVHTAHFAWRLCETDTMRSRAGAVVGLYALLALLVVPVFPHFLSPNEFTRWAFAASLVERPTPGISSVLPLMGAAFEDVSEKDGRVFSNKAPGAPLVAMPGYLLARPLAGPPSASSMRPVLWAMRLFGATLPAVLLALVLSRTAVRLGVSGSRAASVTFALLFATPLFAYGLL